MTKRKDYPWPHREAEVIEVVAQAIGLVAALAFQALSLSARHLIDPIIKPPQDPKFKP